MESVGLNRLGIAGNPLHATLFLDSLSSNGLYFPKFYIPWVSTSRSVFTMLTGIPDVARRTSSRNPIIRDQYSIISEFEDYDKYYMIGGSASWANIRSLVSYNIKGMKLIEMDDINRPRVDVWGVSDLDLFKEADNILKNKQDLSKPSFMIIQTAGNHRPYTIPDDNDGFITKSIKKESLNKAGFKSIEQFNAMRLLDHSIGKFFDLAEESSYYENTIFVLFGDHGTADPQAKHMGLEDYELKLRSYNVPLIIFSPKIIQNPQIINRASGLSDLIPTIAGLCKIPYMNKTIGRDLLISDNNLAFLVNKKMNPTSYGVIDDQFYLRVFRDGSGYELHNILDKDPIKNVRSIFSNEADSLKKIADAIYHTSKYMLYHNNN
jgi:phosphoglycerol transferase MdoB-like AlkP superfamily enzyme